MPFRKSNKDKKEDSLGQKVSYTGYEETLSTKAVWSSGRWQLRVGAVGKGKEVTEVKYFARCCYVNSHLLLTVMLREKNFIFLILQIF